MNLQGSETEGTLMFAFKRGQTFSGWYKVTNHDNLGHFPPFCLSWYWKKTHCICRKICRNSFQTNSKQGNTKQRHPKFYTKHRLTFFSNSFFLFRWKLPAGREVDGVVLGAPRLRCLLYRKLLLPLKDPQTHSEEEIFDSFQHFSFYLQEARQGKEYKSCAKN